MIKKRKMKVHASRVRIEYSDQRFENSNISTNEIGTGLVKVPRYITTTTSLIVTAFAEKIPIEF